MQRYTVQPVSVGDAGLTERPAVVDSNGGRVVKVYRKPEQASADRAATVLNWIDYRGGRVDLPGLRMRADVAGWGFDPRPVVRTLARAGVLTETYSAAVELRYFHIT